MSPPQPVLDPSEVAELEALTGELEGRLTPAAVQASVATAMKIFEPGEKYAYAPTQAIDEARQQAMTDFHNQTGRVLYSVTSQVLKLEPELAAARGRVQPESALEARLRRRGEQGYSQNEDLLVTIATELIEKRVSDELSAASPAHCLAAYEAAIAADDDNTIRVVERLHRRGGWPKPNGKPDATASAAALRLSREITRQKEGRIPEYHREVAKVLKRAKRVRQLAKTLDIPDVEHG